ncbi:ACP S-malonyltransferase [Paenibacillus sp. N1-5-1-14]|uniref:ACP S-malonyltransferase n=1 Tax=Paenibacillus radicibacter TaxID=2972488 RepID=UPI0021596C1B|nr:ACP S-malonyltransferase [Paenibacillus radicibacter]MCR8643272.1 ACP S-malonyltransferase [Paenibacillus radicibacter]
MSIALMFSGQGSQYVGMGQQLCADFSVANQVFEEASDILHMDMKQLCFDGGSELTKTCNAQPAILTVSVAAYLVYQQEIGVMPLLAAGHSLGEYSALACSGVLSFADAVTIVRRRGQWMQAAGERTSGGMLSVFHSSKKQLEQLIDEVFIQGQPLQMACYNAPGQYVLSGHQQAIKAYKERLHSHGISCSDLNVSGAFHSALMQEAAVQMVTELARYSFSEGLYPVISNVDALPYMSVNEMKEMLVWQMTRPVRWTETMDYFQKKGIPVAIELGPKNVLRNLLKKMDNPTIEALALGTSVDVEHVNAQIHAMNLRLEDSRNENLHDLNRIHHLVK